MGRHEDRQEEFREFAATRGARLFRTALLLTGGDWHAAEDLAQTALGKAYASWGRVRRADNRDAYVRSVLVRAHLSQRRLKSSGERPSAELPEGAYGDGDPALRVALLQALAQLPPKDRAVLVLRYWEDRSVEQTAAELGLRAGTVRNRSMSALARLRELLGGDRESLTTI
ncbi:SigE family RNA polymerase sigma factor [Streptomyces sp. TRM66268-LWL]|uniref:SigE family RNA polymerase sigma factor n=1 Tax=Streptomyces polyasparticus TaxID=2767826 RepID=A0ABR7SE65_9ACTN|nr:SigE family RNA polymerase sigma factor [Streptomyces polyasparticus]MBC9713169.1 SigE family RNA polymerase sigma factor [Streptomyces polyasparticus]